MNILFIKHLYVGFMVSEIPRVSVFGYFPLIFIHTILSRMSTDTYFMKYLFLIK